MVLFNLSNSVKKIANGLHSKAVQFSLSFSKKVECNICGWQGKHFIDGNLLPRTVCPKCGSRVRHRLLEAALIHINAVSYQQILERKRVLHFAP